MSEQPNLTHEWPRSWLPKVGKLYHFCRPGSNRKEHDFPVLVISVYETHFGSNGDDIWLDVEVLVEERIIVLSLAVRDQHSVRRQLELIEFLG
jgi:hypothetical protein